MGFPLSSCGWSALRKFDALQTTAPDFTCIRYPYPDNMRMKFDRTRQQVAKHNTLKSGDKLISLKEYVRLVGGTGITTLLHHGYK